MVVFDMAHGYCAGATTRRRLRALWIRCCRADEAGAQNGDERRSTDQERCTAVVRTRMPQARRAFHKSKSAAARRTIPTILPMIGNAPRPRVERAATRATS